MVRRVLAMAICVVGGAALYLAPIQLGDARSQLDQSRPTVATSEDTNRSVVPSLTPAATTAPQSTVSPSLHQDRTLPSPVRNLRLSSNTARTYTVSWGSSRDAAGIRHYVVLANGFLVGRTDSASITLVWPTTTDNILVQVAPVDGNGLQGEWRALMIVPPPLQGPATTAWATSATPRLPSTSRSQTPSTTPSPSPDTTSESPSPTPSAPDSCSTQDATRTATATTSAEPSATPSRSVPQTTLSPSASTSPTPEPSSALSSEPGMSPIDQPTDIPSC